MASITHLADGGLRVELSLADIAGLAGIRTEDLKTDNSALRLYAARPLIGSMGSAYGIRITLAPKEAQ